MQGRRFLDETLEKFARRKIRDPYRGGKFEGLVETLEEVDPGNMWDAQVDELVQTRDTEVVATDEPVLVALAFRMAKERRAKFVAEQRKMLEKQLRFAEAVAGNGKRKHNRRAA